MSWRTIIITNQAKLDLNSGFMVVRGMETKKVVLDEIAILVLENPAISLTGCLMEALIEHKVRIIFCDSKRNPIGELTPHHGSHDSSAKIRTQAVWREDVKALIWDEIISEKIRKQADFLAELEKDREAELLRSYIGGVEMKDATNREGHAAKVYFNALFGMSFTRSADNPINAALNYGYSIILSAFNREICANGYITQLGIFHNNMFNHYNLACDLMEPYRILVDRLVRSMELTKFGLEEKHALWSLLEYTVLLEDQRQHLSKAIAIYTKSVFDAINDNDPSRIKHYEIAPEANFHL